MRSPLFLAFSTLLLSACGPTEVEAGQAVLFSAALITLIGGGVTALFAALWKPLAKNLQFSWRPTLVVIAGQAILQGMVLVFVGTPIEGTHVDDWVLTALLTVGTSYLSLQLIVVRVALIERVRRYYSLLSLAPWIVLYPPAVVLGVWGSGDEAGDIPLSLWILPGYVGMTTLVILVVFGVELVFRRRRLALSEREPEFPAPLPTAQARFSQKK